MRRERARRSAGPAGRATAGLFVAVLTMTACSGTSDDDTERDDARVYTEVLRAVAPDAAATLPKVIYVELVDGAELTIEDQALVVNAFRAPTTVRFVDERAEAVDDSLAQPHVRRDGVLVTLGATATAGDATTVKATRYISAVDQRTVCVDLQEQNRSWSVTATRPC